MLCLCVCVAGGLAGGIWDRIDANELMLRCQRLCRFDQRRPVEDLQPLMQFSYNVVTVHFI